MARHVLAILSAVHGAGRAHGALHPTAVEVEYDGAVVTGRTATPTGRKSDSSKRRGDYVKLLDRDMAMSYDERVSRFSGKKMETKTKLLAQAAERDKAKEAERRKREGEAGEAGEAGGEGAKKMVVEAKEE